MAVSTVVSGFSSVTIAFSLPVLLLNSLFPVTRSPSSKALLVIKMPLAAGLQFPKLIASLLDTWQENAIDLD